MDCGSRYLISAASDSQNQTKATWFQQALGFDQSNWQQLASQITFNESTAVATKITQYGQTFEQIIPISGANGKAVTCPGIFGPAEI
jgi:filamentous hemagglutinin